jgi:hypothetical protein
MAKKAQALMAPQSADQLVEVIRIVGEVFGDLKDIAKERTRQEEVRAQAAVEVERIRGVRDALLAYLDKSFDERRENFAMLFKKLDQAMEKEDPQIVGTVLNSIVALAESSPFKALADVSATQKVLRDKGTEWEF